MEFVRVMTKLLKRRVTFVFVTYHIVFAHQNKNCRYDGCEDCYDFACADCCRADGDALLRVGNVRGTGEGGGR